MTWPDTPLRILAVLSALAATVLATIPVISLYRMPSGSDGLMKAGLAFILGLVIVGVLWFPLFIAWRLVVQTSKEPFKVSIGKIISSLITTWLVLIPGVLFLSLAQL